jgi:hypothetical protein
MPLESTISKSIIAAIKREFPSAVARKRHVIQGVMGDPDVYGCLPGGKHFEIEVKQGGKWPTTLQYARLAAWKAAGAITGVAHDRDEAIGILLEGLYGVGRGPK